MDPLTIPIRGMSCDNCVREVGQAIRRVPGVLRADVSVGSATVKYDPAIANPAVIAAAIAFAGYTPQEA
ncbi:MAG: heavy-metal-associated domain-containing protein [Gemmatimonadaceae bacterium]|nr:heavy-metal-associated domain-containing protein [Gemmatimonadaceae bacterium]